MVASLSNQPTPNSDDTSYTGLYYFNPNSTDTAPSPWNCTDSNSNFAYRLNRFMDQIGDYAEDAEKALRNRLSAEASKKAIAHLATLPARVLRHVCHLPPVPRKLPCWSANRWRSVT